MDKNIIRNNEISPQELLKDLIRPSSFISVITGLLASGKNEIVLSTGRLAKAAMTKSFFQQLASEIETHKKRVKITAAAVNIENSTLYELIQIIDEGKLDQEKFNALKKLFNKSLNSDDLVDKILVRQFIRITNELSSEEITIISQNYELTKTCYTDSSFSKPDTVPCNITSANDWLTMLARKIGHNIPSLIEEREQHLIDLKLISRRVHTDLSGVDSAEKVRLTKLGLRLCEFLNEETRN